MPEGEQPAVVASSNGGNTNYSPTSANIIMATIRPLNIQVCICFVRGYNLTDGAACGKKDQQERVHFVGHGHHWRGRASGRISRNVYTLLDMGSIGGVKSKGSIRKMLLVRADLLARTLQVLEDEEAVWVDGG
eukprot:scaffold116124_cov17-Tisochrysis_lutea.AAC.3